jgi:hypothetical protein
MIGDESDNESKLKQEHRSNYQPNEYETEHTLHPQLSLTDNETNRFGEAGNPNQERTGEFARERSLFGEVKDEDDEAPMQSKPPVRSEFDSIEKYSLTDEDCTWK